MKFSELPYKRPDLEATKKELQEVLTRFRNAKTFEEADKAYVDMDRVGGNFFTQRTIASIRRDIDTRDAFYDGEKTWYNQVGPELQETFQEFDLATLKSPFRKELEAKYGNVSFLNAELGLKTFSPEIIPDLQKENELVSQYTKLIASAQIPFEDGVYTLAQIATFKEESDDARRLAAWKAEGQWYLDHGQELDELYDQLVKIRHKMAQKLGFENGEGLADAIRKLKDRIGMRSDLKEFNLSEADVKELAVQSQHPNLKNNPVEITLEMLTEMYQSMV